MALSFTVLPCSISSDVRVHTFPLSQAARIESNAWSIFVQNKVWRTLRKNDAAANPCDGAKKGEAEITATKIPFLPIPDFFFSPSTQRSVMAVGLLLLLSKKRQSRAQTGYPISRPKV